MAAPTPPPDPELREELNSLLAEFDAAFINAYRRRPPGVWVDLMREVWLDDVFDVIAYHVFGLRGLQLENWLNTKTETP